MYLKQVGVICYLAHLGCWVPAKSATIPIIDGIYTRIQTVDSIALGLSAFTVDLNQMSRALNNATGQSLGCVHLLILPHYKKIINEIIFIHFKCLFRIVNLNAHKLQNIRQIISQMSK